MTKSRTAKRGKHAKRQASSATHSRQNAERDAALAHAGRLHNAGDLDAAKSIYQKLLALDPQHHRALFLLGLVEHQRGDQHAARAHFDRLVALQDTVADYHLWFARILRALGDTPAALAAARRCRELEPRHAAAIQTQSLLLRELGQPQEALCLLRDAVAADPQRAQLLASLGETYLALGDPTQARTALEKALELDGQLCEAWINLGVALQAEGQPAAATLAFEQVLRLAPDNADAHYNFAATLEHNHALERAIAHAQRALELRPERGDWHTALAGMLSEVGEFEQALALYRQGLHLRPHPREHSSFLALQLYLPSEAPARLSEARKWAARYVPAPPETASSEAGDAAHTRRSRRADASVLRVGYVSADFRQHSVSYFFEPLAAAHDASRVTVTCYANSKDRDAVTARLAERATMRCIVDMSDSQVAEQIRADDIDVLVDLSGHTLGHRLSVFAHHCAPVQLAYLGYPGTTGVPAIRWRLTDALVDPEPCAQSHYSERLYRLPRAFCCFRPPEAAPDVSPLPASRQGWVTFGSLNKYMKITDPVLRTWSQLLNSIPDSRLILQSRLFVDPASCTRVRRRFAEYGVAAERLELYGTMPLTEHLRLYEKVDIALDTFPWNGHTTSCLALHMGVPVLALAGEAGASRMGVSVLSAAGLGDWVVPDEAAYVAKAQRWASEPQALATLRAGLREQVARSALCDAQSLARSVEAAYVELLERRPS